MGDREAFENAYYYYVFALRVLAASPEEACEMNGYFNAGFEIKRDVELVPPIFDWPISPLTAEQKSGIINLVAVLQSIPEEVLSFTNIRQESLAKMRHPCWLPAREMASRLLDKLGPVTERNTKYFEQGSRET
jgi:hypothetical protein